MTTSLDPSVDEMLLLQGNQYQMPNNTLANIKPIGAERKISQPTRTSSYRSGYSMTIARDIHENRSSWHSFEIPSSISTKLSTADHLHFSAVGEPIVQQMMKEYPHRFDEPSSRLLSCTIDSYEFQRQPSRLSAKSVNSTRIASTKTIPSFSTPHCHSTSRFSIPHNYGNPFSNRCQATRSFLPVFATPFQCTRERFQVNSIGRPILRTNNYNHSSSAHGFQIRR